MTRPTEADRRRAALSQVIEALTSIRRRAWALLTLRRVLLTLAAAVGVVVTLGLLDLVLRLPAGLRWVHWAVGLVALGAAAWIWIWPAIRFRPTLTQVALRIEQSEEGQSAGLRGLLATGLELSDDIDQPGVRGALSARAVREAADRFRAYRGHLVAKAPALRAGGALFMALAVVATLALVSPTYTKIGAVRTLAPWVGASWPRLTEVVSATEREVQALGVAVPLRAALLRTPEPLGQTRVEAHYRVIANGQSGPEQRVALTGQRRHVSIERGGTVTPAELYERLVEITPPAGADEAVVEYWFQTRDHRSSSQRLRLVEPPSVARARAEIMPPPYAAQLAAAPAAASFRAGEFELGAGSDERASVGPILAGSTVDLQIRLNKAVPGPQDDPRAFARATFGSERWADALWTDGDIWRLRFTAESSVRLPVIVQDEHGIRSAEEAVFSFDVTQDDPATVAVTEPAEDNWYLPTAVVNLEGEGRDRVGLAWLELRRQRLRPPQGSPGAPAEPLDDEQAIARRDLSEPGVRETIGFELELGGLEVAPGDVVEIVAVAQDTLGASALAAGAEPLSGRPARSPARRLRIIDEATFLEQAHGSLATIRETAKRLDEDQRQLAAGLRGEEEAAGAVEAEQGASRQSGISERIDQQAEAVERLQRRAEQNRLEDPALAELLEQARRRLADAGRQSVEASGALSRQARAEEADDAQQGQQAQREAQRAQDGVRDELGRLIDLLDRGEDTWMVRRDLQRALEQQRELRRQTEEATRDTVGQRPDELSPQQQQRLDELARQQEELARQMREVIEELSQRADASAERNPTGAEAMRQAAERGRSEQAAENMREASRQIDQNQGQSATDQQDRAIETLEQMAQDLDQAERNRDEQLRRALADLLETIEQLIAAQQRELDRLTAAEQDQDYAGLDGAMIELSRNTLGAAEQARAGFQELESVAAMLLEAAAAQEQAIVVLRASVVTAGEAREHELASLDALTRARDEAERLRREADQREAQRQRAELERAYREALEQQIALRDETSTFRGAEMNRRQQMLVRRLSGRQSEIRKSLGILRDEISDLESTAVFSYAHDRIDRASRAAEDLLRTGAAGDAALRRQNEVIRVLQGMLQALRDLNRQQDEEFSRGAQGGSGDGGQGQGGEEEGAVPEMAELLLLKAMQQEAADYTRAIHDGLLDVEELPGVTQLQRDLSQRGDMLIEQLQQQQGQQPDARQQPRLHFRAPGFQDEQAQQEQPEQQHEPRRPPQDLPGLDELLGLEEEEEAGEDAGGQLEEILSEREISERFQEAVRLMGQTASRLDQRDTGLTTQRLQEDILARLDAMIAAADRRERQQQQQRQQQRGDPEQAPAQQQQQAQAQNPEGDNRGEESVVGQQRAQLGPEAARGAEWGMLPPKWRDALRQGDADAFSDIYRAATEAYYRRLAEEARR